MKHLIKTGLVAVMLSMPLTAFAQGGGMMGGMMTAGKNTGAINCPMAGDMEFLQKNMSDMMTQMNGMMGSTSDPALKKQMQVMHDQMSQMMTHMQKMQGMMGSGMMDNGMMKGNATSTPDNEQPDKK